MLIYFALSYSPDYVVDHLCKAIPIAQPCYIERKIGQYVPIAPYLSLLCRAHFFFVCDTSIEFLIILFLCCLPADGKTANDITLKLYYIIT